MVRRPLAPAHPLRGAPVESKTGSFEIIVEIGIVEDHRADCQTVAVLDQILPVDHPRSVRGHRELVNSNGPPATKKTAMAVERQPPGPQILRVGFVNLHTGIGY